MDDLAATRLDGGGEGVGGLGAVVGLGGEDDEPAGGRGLGVEPLHERFDLRAGRDPGLAGERLARAGGSALGEQECGHPVALAPGTQRLGLQREQGTEDRHDTSEARLSAAARALSSVSPLERSTS